MKKDIHFCMHVTSRCVARLGLFALILGLSVAALSTFAQSDLLESAGQAITGGAYKTPGAIIGDIIQIVLGFLGLVFVILTIYAGFMYMMSEGEAEKAKKARALLVNAIIGAAIVISAWAITYFVLTSLTQSVKPLGGIITPVWAAEEGTTRLEGTVHGPGSQFIEAGKVFGIGEHKDVADVGVIIGNIINIIFGLLGVFLVIIIMYSGFQWMTSSGEVEKAKKARRNLTNALIGAAIVMLAWSISYGVINIITSDIVQ